MKPKRHREDRSNTDITRLVQSLNRNFNKTVSAAMGIRQGFLNDDIMLSGGDLIDAVSALEEEFGIEVSDEDYIAIETVGDARDIVMDLLLQKAVET